MSFGHRVGPRGRSGNPNAEPDVRVAELFSSLTSVLCVGAHPDDIEIGSGATLRVMRRAQPALDMRWLVLTSTPERASEAHVSAGRYLGDANLATVLSFRDGHLPYDEPAAVKAALIAHRRGFVPDLVLAPSLRDAHQDHRFVGELVGQVYRDQVVLHYETAKYEGDLGTANVYVPASEEDVRRKIDDLLAAYPSQVTKPWFEESLFRGLMRLRGVEAKATSGYAEAFHAPKLIVS